MHCAAAGSQQFPRPTTCTPPRRSAPSAHGPLPLRTRRHRGLLISRPVIPTSSAIAGTVSPLQCPRRISAMRLSAAESDNGVIAPASTLTAPAAPLVEYRASSELTRPSPCLAANSPAPMELVVADRRIVVPFCAQSAVGEHPCCLTSRRDATSSHPAVMRTFPVDSESSWRTNPRRDRRETRRRLCLDPARLIASFRRLAPCSPCRTAALSPAERLSSESR